MWYRTIDEWLTGGIPCALATITHTEGSSPRPAGAKMAVNGNGKITGSVGGGDVEHICREEALRAIKEQCCITLDFSLRGDQWQVTPEKSITGTCGGTVTVFIEPLLPPAEVVVFGGGHIGERLGKLCEVLYMPFRIFDNRPDFCSEERFPAARECICKPYESISESIHLSRSSYCVILTHGHTYDETCLEQLLKNGDIPYIGMIGSRNKIAVVIANIRSRGGVVDNRLYSPVGLRIADSRPEQIALGIMAQIIMLINRGTPEHMRIPWHEQPSQQPVPKEAS